MSPLTARDAELLTKILGRLGSDFDGERATAGAMATKFLKERGLAWDEVIRPQVPVPAEPDTAGEGFCWRQMVNRCLAEADRLSVWERRFLRSLAAWRGTPTAKQSAVLHRIADKLGIEP